MLCGNLFPRLYVLLLTVESQVCNLSPDLPSKDSNTDLKERISGEQVASIKQSTCEQNRLQFFCATIFIGLTCLFSTLYFIRTVFFWDTKPGPDPAWWVPIRTKYFNCCQVQLLLCLMWVRFGQTNLAWSHPELTLLEVFLMYVELLCWDHGKYCN